MNMAAAHTDYNLKIIIIGDSGVGKAVILRKYTVDKFVESPPIGKCQYSCTYV